MLVIAKLRDDLFLMNDRMIDFFVLSPFRKKSLYRCYLG